MTWQLWVCLVSAVVAVAAFVWTRHTYRQVQRRLRERQP